MNEKMDELSTDAVHLENIVLDVATISNAVQDVKEKADTFHPRSGA